MSNVFFDVHSFGLANKHRLWARGVVHLRWWYCIHWDLPFNERDLPMLLQSVIWGDSEILFACRWSNCEYGESSDWSRFGFSADLQKQKYSFGSWRRNIAKFKVRMSPVDGFWRFGRKIHVFLYKKHVYKNPYTGFQNR